MRNDLSTVLTYFGSFSYAPTFEEIHLFFPKKITKKDLQKLLKQEVTNETIRIIHSLRDNNIISLSQGSSNHQPQSTNHSCYTLPQYSISMRHSERSEESSEPRGERKARPPSWRTRSFGSSPQDDTSSASFSLMKTYVSLLKIFPPIQFVGVTGASAMRGLRNNDDLDICIVTKQNMLWTTRFIVVFLAKIMRIHNRTGVCLNLFFDESDLSIPKIKQNSYIAHELLQMKPVVDKNAVYGRFIENNKWIYRYFPNAKPLVILGRSQMTTPESMTRFWTCLPAGRCAKQCSLTRMTLWQPFEFFIKYAQLPLIRRNKVDFLITSTQLWLFKNDYEKKLKRKGLVL